MRSRDQLRVLLPSCPSCSKLCDAQALLFVQDQTTGGPRDQETSLRAPALVSLLLKALPLRRLFYLSKTNLQEDHEIKRPVTRALALVSLLFKALRCAGSSVCPRPNYRRTTRSRDQFTCSCPRVALVESLAFAQALLLVQDQPTGGP